MNIRSGKCNKVAVFALLAVGELEVLTSSVHAELYIIGHEDKMDQAEASDHLPVWTVLKFILPEHLNHP